MSATPFAYARDGSVLVLADGPEIYVFGANDGPLWRGFADGILVAVAGRQTEIISIDTDGKLVSWRGIDGKREEESHTDLADPRAIALRSDGTCAVLARDTVWIGRPGGDGRRLPAPKGTAVAWAPDGSLAIGDADGNLRVFDPAGKPLAGGAVAGAVQSIAHRAPAQWLVAHESQLSLVALDGKTLAATIGLPGPATTVDVSADGALFLALVGRTLHVGEHAAHRLIGTVELQRDAGGAAFGAEHWIAVGYDEGEGNRVDVTTGLTRKTEPAPGKVAGKWGIQVSVEPMTARQAVTTVRTAGKAIATHIRHGEESSGGCLKSCLIFALLFFLCSGCTGIFGALYYFVYLP